MIIVTGGAGFIGSNLIAGLNQRGRSDILVVDDLRQGEKFINLADLQIEDYLDKADFLARTRDRENFAADALFHQGACSVTTEWDGQYMMRNNFEYSKKLLHYCLHREIPFIYASSAAVYGAGRGFREEPGCERPLNVYAYSKLLFDQYVRKALPAARTQIAGCRYFNVYGPREQHKNEMASVVYHLRRQWLESAKIRLFGACGNCEAGEQRRDFIHVSDTVAVNLWLFDHPKVSGIFNVGTGKSRSFNAMAHCVLDHYGKGELEYIAFPDHLKGHYQSFTEADISLLRKAGYEAGFTALEDGVRAYLDYLEKA